MSDEEKIYGSARRQKASVCDKGENKRKGFHMLWLIIIVLVVLWVIALLVAKIASVLIHLLLVAAVVIFILNLIRGRKAV